MVRTGLEWYQRQCTESIHSIACVVAKQNALETSCMESQIPSLADLSPTSCNLQLVYIESHPWARMGICHVHVMEHQHRQHNNESKESTSDLDTQMDPAPAWSHGALYLIPKKWTPNLPWDLTSFLFISSPDSRKCCLLWYRKYCRLLSCFYDKNHQKPSNGLNAIIGCKTLVYDVSPTSAFTWW